MMKTLEIILPESDDVRLIDVGPTMSELKSLSALRVLPPGRVLHVAYCG